MSTIAIGSNTAEPRLYISSYNSLLGQSIYFKFELPRLLNNNLQIKNIQLITGEEDYLTNKELQRLNLDLDPTTPLLDNITYTFKNVGVYYIQYNVTLVNGTVKTYYVETPINILKSWPSFKQEDIRILGENILKLPFDFDQIAINPNEFGVASVYNNSVNKLNANLEYLKANTRVLNSKTPFLYYGWLGVDGTMVSEGLKWSTINYGEENMYMPSYAKSINGGFSNIKEIAEASNRMFVLDDRGINVYINSNKPRLMRFSNMGDILSTTTEIVSFDVKEDGKLMYLLDSIQNKIYRVDIDYDSQNNGLYETYNPLLSLTYNVGFYGNLENPYGLNNPTQLMYQNGYIYVLDYNNQAVKVYTENLEWVYTYYNQVFETNQPISVAVQKNTRFAYVLTQNKIYVFRFKNSNIVSTIDISNLTHLQPIKITFDEAGEFFYVLTKTSMFKYTTSGLYMDVVDLPASNLTFTSAKQAPNRNILISTQNAILKIQEITDIVNTGEGLETNYWAVDQLRVYENELVQDIHYNRSLSRMVQNLLNFRNSLESKLQLVSEYTVAGVLNYFSLAPLKQELRPLLADDVENNNVSVGVNELHNLSVINREFKKIYDSLVILKNFLDIDVVSIDSSLGKSLNKCKSLFCWSWSAMSTYNLTKPMIRMCNINPISFAELKSSFPSNYVSSKRWIDAKSSCCNKYEAPK